MPKSSRNDIYEAVIRKQVTRVLEEQERAFEREHEEDTGEELCAYLCLCAKQLGYTPRYKEVVGWRLVDQRFGSWKAGLRAAGLDPEDKCPITKLHRIREETRKQEALYRQRRAEKKRLHRDRMEARAQRNGKDPAGYNRENKEAPI